MDAKSNNYSDIINTKYPFKLKHARMSISDRAAQFSAFRALSGFEAVIHETARSTDEQVELDESLKDILNTKLKCIKGKASKLPLIQIVYFVPDANKDGGKYVTVLERVKRIDEYTKSVQTVSGLNIPIKDIYEIELFEESSHTSYHESAHKEPGHVKE